VENDPVMQKIYHSILIVGIDLPKLRTASLLNTMYMLSEILFHFDMLRWCMHSSLRSRYISRGGGGRGGREFMGKKQRNGILCIILLPLPFIHLLCRLHVQ